MTHTEESLMALAQKMATAARGDSDGFIDPERDALPLAIREVLAERDALAAAMPSEGADCAIGYAHMKNELAMVIHTAGLQRSRTPYFGFQVNLIGTLNVAEAVRLTGVRRLIHASSQGVYDLRNPPVPIHEEAPRDGGARVYQGGKAACEEVLTAYAATYKFELALPRFASVYGYGPYTGGGNVGMDMYAMLQAALAGKPAPMGSGIADANDFVYVKDIAQGLRLMTHPRICRTKPTTLAPAWQRRSPISSADCKKSSATCGSRASRRRDRGRRWIFVARGRNWVMSRSLMLRQG